MQISSSKVLNNELQQLSYENLYTICKKLIKLKKENKEYVHYLLFENNDEQQFIQKIKSEISEMFLDVNTQSVFFAKKTIRKIIRTTNKYCKFSSINITYIELNIHCCKHMKSLPMHWSESKVMTNMYNSLVEKSKHHISLLHEDLQFDFTKMLEKIDDSTN